MDDMTSPVRLGAIDTLDRQVDLSCAGYLWSPVRNTPRRVSAGPLVMCICEKGGRKQDERLRSPLVLSVQV